MISLNKRKVTLTNHQPYGWLSTLSDYSLIIMFTTFEGMKRLRTGSAWPRMRLPQKTVITTKLKVKLMPDKTGSRRSIYTRKKGNKRSEDAFSESGCSWASCSPAKEDNCIIGQVNLQKETNAQEDNFTSQCLHKPPKPCVFSSSHHKTENM
ncbi:hypothetical protein M5689_018974 [Euphorbia peplus]|nr:hypothetical protein M5689_018974 [Euphorbia peplus]